MAQFDMSEVLRLVKVLQPLKPRIDEFADHNGFDFPEALEALLKNALASYDF